MQLDKNNEQQNHSGAFFDKPRLCSCLNNLIFIYQLEQKVYKYKCSLCNKEVTLTLPDGYELCQSCFGRGSTEGSFKCTACKNTGLNSWVDKVLRG